MTADLAHRPTPGPANSAARFLGDGVIEIRSAPMGPLAAGEVRVRVDVCALCGSDKRLLAKGSPVVPGHEIAGTVVATSPGTGIPVGRRGIVYIPVWCRQCTSCLAGQTNRCLELSELIGWQRDGGFADLVDVPVRCLLPVPDDIPQDVAVLGLDTVGTAAHGLRMALRTQETVPERVLVVGCGPLGIGVVAVAQAMGIAHVDAYDPHPGRFALAQALGASALEDPDAENQYELVVEVSGARQARALAQRTVRPGGAVLALGESDEPYTMPATPRWRRSDCFTVRSFYFPLTEVEQNWDLLRRCGARLRDSLATPMSLPELSQAFDAFVAGEYLKPFITPGDRP